MDTRRYSVLSRYIESHWHGQQSLARSFWLNLVALRVLVFTVQSLFHLDQWQGIDAWRGLIVAAVLVFHGLLLIWQIVGVVRAADTDFAERGNMALVWGAQLGGVLFLILSGIYAIEAVRSTMVSPVELDPFARMDREHASRYSLSVTDLSVAALPESTLPELDRQLTIDGFIELGITRAVKRKIVENPSITLINLNSTGGNIYEARGLAKLFETQKLNTHVQHVCSSACNTAYVGGFKRSAAAEARFGFHQYRVDAEYTIVATDVHKEQARDAALFHKAGVSQEFVDAMFDQPPGNMWWPSRQTLLRAGFIHETRVMD